MKRIIAVVLFMLALMLPAIACKEEGTQWVSPPPTFDNPTPDYSID